MSSSSKSNSKTSSTSSKASVPCCKAAAAASVPSGKALATACKGCGLEVLQHVANSAKVRDNSLREINNVSQCEQTWSAVVAQALTVLKLCCARLYFARCLAPQSILSSSQALGLRTMRWLRPALEAYAQRQQTASWQHLPQRLQRLPQQRVAGRASQRGTTQHMPYFYL